MAEPFAAQRPKPKPLQELRRLTVLFCDMVGSTELGSQLDIEDYCALIDDFKDLCRERVQAAGGWLAQFQGDGVLAYFGYPALFEDPARRAVHAGLSIIDELKSRSFTLPSDSEVSLKVRVSVHTGPVLTYATKEADTQLPEGVAINIAKKVQQFAADNTVIVTSETEELVRRHFFLQGPRKLTIDPIKTELSVYEVRAERPEAARTTDLFEGNLPPMVARRAELQLIDERWRLTQQGLGQCVLLLGEAGIGKSRLIHEFKRQCGIPDDAWCEVRCTPDTVDSAFFPFRKFLASRLSGPALADVRPLRQQVAGHLESIGLLTEANEQALLSLLGALPRTTDADPVLPAVIRKRIKEFLVAYFLACSENSAFVLAFEDLHWADASTREIVQTLALRCRSSSLLIVCAQRQEGEHPFAGRADITSLVLNPLPPLHVKELVDSLSLEREISEPQAEQLFHLTGGNPLFVEQYIASKEQGRAEETAGLPAKDARSGLGDQVPPSLKELIAYRLEQLGDAKRVAQCAAVLGQYIHPGILQRVVDMEAEPFEQIIVRLVRSEILAYTGQSLLPELRFQHALVRDAAYETLLVSQRQKLHRRVAEQLVEEQPNNDLITHEVIARHFALAREARRSIDHWEQAAAQASSRFANAEALANLREALAQIPALPAGEAEAAEMEIREALAVPLEATLGWAAEETESNLQRLLDLKTSGADEEELFSVYHGVCSMHGIRGEVTKALEYAEKMQAIADRSGDLALRVLSLRVSGILYFLRADFSTALRLFEEMAEVYEDEVRDRVSVHYPANPVAVGFAFSALALAVMGEKEGALELLARARHVISSERDEFTRAYVEGFASSVFLTLGNYDAGIASAETCMSLAGKNSFDYWTSWAKITLGYGRLAKGAQDSESLALIEEGLNAYRSTGSRQILPYALGLFADALIKSGRDQAALRVIEELERERQENEVAFFDGFNDRLLAWRRGQIR